MGVSVVVVLLFWIIFVSFIFLYALSAFIFNLCAIPALWQEVIFVFLSEVLFWFWFFEANKEDMYPITKPKTFLYILLFTLFVAFGVIYNATYISKLGAREVMIILAFFFGSVAGFREVLAIASHDRTPDLFEGGWND